jgi:hypothetical protein
MPNVFDQFDEPSGTILTNPAQAGQMQGQALTNQRTMATLPYEAPQAGATLARTQQAVQDRPFERGDKLRADFDKRQQVQDYRTSAPLLISALKSKRDPQGDNALVYAYAKIMDPNSVVRESEADTAVNTAGIVAATVEKWKKNLGFEDAVGLPRGTSAGLLREMNTKVAQYAKAYGTVRRDFQDLAKRQGVNADDVVGRSPAEPFIGEYEKLSKQMGWTDQPSAASTGASGPSQVDPTGASPNLSPEDRQFLSQNARYMTPQAVQQWYKDKTGGRATITDQNAQEVYDYYAKGGQQDAVVNVGQGAASAVGEALATPVGTGVANYLNAASFGIPQLAAGDQGFEALRARNPGSALAGDILGGITGTAGLAGAGLKAGLSVPRAATGANLAYGTAFGANTNEDNRLLGGLGGAGAALVGEGLGRYVAAPAIDALARSRVGQAVGGMFGRQAPRRVSRPETSLADEIAPGMSDIQANLQDAVRLGLPMSLADASPAARSTLGAATRLDPMTLETVGKGLAERGLARNERAASALSNLAEPVDMRATTDEIFRGAQDAASPFYGRAYANPAITTPELESLLQRPSLQQAMGRARGTIAEEGGDPNTIGFALDAQGNPVLNPLPTGQMAELGAANTALSEAQDALARGNASLAGNVDRKGLQDAVDQAQARVAAAQSAVDAAPSAETLATAPAYNWRALDYTKRGLDDVLEGLRDPVTRQLPSDYQTRAIQNSRVSFRNALGGLNDDYRQGLNAYSDIARRNDDLNAGYRMAGRGVTDRDFNVALDAAGDAGRDYFQRGYVTNLSDQINRATDNTNAYNLVAGTPGQRNRLTSMFPNADDFLRQRDLENLMGQTRNEVLGGSATAGRQSANERLSSPNLGLLAELGVSAAAGMPPVWAMAHGAQHGLRGMFGRRSAQMTQENARAIAPMLAEQNPATASAALDSLLGDVAAQRRYNDLIKAIGAGVTAPGLTGLYGSY